MRIVTYNVHGCRGTDAQYAPERIAEVIADSRADVACLQELDAGRARSGGVRQAEAVARVLTMQFHFAPAIRAADEEYGDAILSRYPMRVRKVGELPRYGAREPRGVMWVEIEGEGARWQVLNTHLGLGRLERRIQARAMAEWVRAAVERPPVVFCGDLNSRPGSLVHSLIAPGLRDVQRGAQRRHVHTFATRWPWICLDYIYTSPDLRVAHVEVITSPLTRVASDHFPVVAELHRRSEQGRERT
jgi:endonuclease/exonuclease/phosphatase family metal-dependent hydrolase